jgi:hypothetical protein
MAPALIIAGVGAGIAAVGTVSSISAQKKAAKANKKQFAYQRQQDDLRAARERREAIRAARLSMGTASQNSVNQGAENSSAALGGLGSIASQLSGNLSFLDKINTLSDQASIQAGKVSKYTSQAQTAGAVAGLGAAVFSNSQDIADGVFGKPKVS